MSVFTPPEYPKAVEGVLDLSEWDKIDEYPLKLDGEWAFYPQSFVTTSTTEPVDFITVPSVWKESTKPSNTYGYGTYHLRIIVDSDKLETYALYFKKFGSAISIYVNGAHVASQGEVGKTKEQYTPSVKPLQTSFTVAPRDEIDLFIQVTNFDNPKNGGIVNAIKFGKANVFYKELSLESNIVYFACLIYFIHVIYCFIIYFVVKQDKRLIYFALLTLLVIIATLIGERLFYTIIPLNFEHSIKLTFLSCIAGGYVVFLYVHSFIPKTIRLNLSRIFVAICIIAVLVIMLTSGSFLLGATLYFLLIPVVPALFFPFIFYHFTKQFNKDSLYLMLAATAIGVSFIWFVIIEVANINTISYPLDLLIAIFCIATYWFKQYHLILERSEEMTTQLQIAEKQREDFLLRVGHEMRNPLHGMINLSQAVAAREKNTLHSKSAYELDVLLSVGRSMSLLLNDLLDLARFKHNKIVIHPTNVSIYTVVDSVIEMLKYRTERVNITFTNQIPRDFPLVYADENRLIQIMFNLLYNAVKHSEASEVIVQATVKENEASISISDNGIGIEANHLQTILEPYQQVHTNDTVEDNGFGLGLNICKQLIELHGGELQVASKLHEGTTFSFSLKLSTIEIANHIHSERDEALLFPTVLNNQLSSHLSDSVIRIIAVDDDPVNLQVLQSIFSMDRYYVYVTTSPNEVLEIIDGMKWDIVIADVLMPKMSGYSLTARIREKYSLSELPVLLLTAYNREEDIETGFRVGANDYVMKPVNAVELKSRVQSLTKLKRSVNDRLRMEAAWLHAQIKPHFIYNTFNTIAALSRMDLDRMDALLTKLSDYIHLSIDFQNEEGLTLLEDELKLINAYLYILKERFADRFHVKWDVDDIEHVYIPPLSIQTIVENALHHGVLKKMEGGTITIQIQRQANSVTITVIDDGIGMSPETLRTLLQRKAGKKSGIGLINTERRLKQLFGTGLTIKSTIDVGTTVAFTVPLHDPQ